MKYYLGLDNGGTGTKAGIFDQVGREIAVAETATGMLVPKPGFTERNMEEMWEANCFVIREAIRKASINPADIACVTCCGHGKGLYLWGYDNKPVRNGIISTDNRAWSYPLKWEENGVAKQVFELSCQHILASQPVSLLAWLRDNEPSIIEKSKYIFECKDYVRFRLTGEAFAERTDYSGANFLNLHTGSYDVELLKLFGLEDCMEKLPPLRDATDICGYILPEVAKETGLFPGTPVAGGAFDIDACAIAVNVVSEENICMIAGTWSINEYISRKPVLNGSIMMNSIFSLPEYYLIEECSPTSAGNNEWFIKTLLPEMSDQNAYVQMNTWVEAVPATEFCPTFLPFLMASNVHPNAMGSFIGMSNFHTRAHLARSVYEGIAFSHRYHLEKLLHTREKKPKAIRLAGGVTRSKVWTQMFADVMKLPVEVVDVNETGALGCAIIGATATGAYQTLAEAAGQMCRISPTVQPHAANCDIYDEKYYLYIKTIEVLDPLWDSLQAYRDKKRGNQ